MWGLLMEVTFLEHQLDALGMTNPKFILLWVLKKIFIYLFSVVLTGYPASKAGFTTQKGSVNGGCRES